MKNITNQLKGLLGEMLRSIKPASGWKVVLVDKISISIISAACRMYDVMEEGVTCKKNTKQKKKNQKKIKKKSKFPFKNQNYSIIFFQWLKILNLKEDL